MKYIYKARKISCVTLEDELALPRGDIQQITIIPDKMVIVETREALALINKARLDEIMAQMNMIEVSDV